MKTVTVNREFFRITKKKVFITLMIPLLAVLSLFSGFVLDEIFGGGGSAIVNTLYLLANNLYLFVLLPLSFIDIDSVAPVVLKTVLLLVPIWWYFLSCFLNFLVLLVVGNSK